MTKWGAWIAAAKPLAPWLMIAAIALILAGGVAGSNIRGMIAQSAIAKAEKRYADAVAAAERNARAELERRLAERNADAARDRDRAEMLAKELEKLRRAAAANRKRLNNALRVSSLRRCDARGVARILRERADSVRRRMSRAPADPS